MKTISCNVCLESNWIYDGKTFGPKRCPGHPALTETKAVAIFSETIKDRLANGRFVGPPLFEIARFLTLFDFDNPCPRRLLEAQFCPMDVPSHNERRIKKWVEDLRREWLLPIGSKKSGGGYYFITDAADFIRWQKENIAPALTAIQTNYRVFRHNFKDIAGQQRLDFRVHLEDDLRAALEGAA